MKTAVIGVGNMGSVYAGLIQDGHIPGLELAALTRVRGHYREILKPSIDRGTPVFDSAEKLFDAVEKGCLKRRQLSLRRPTILMSASQCGLSATVCMS